MGDFGPVDGRQGRSYLSQALLEESEVRSQISVGSSKQRRISGESAKSDRKFSTQEESSRWISVPGRRISAASYFNSWKKPTEVSAVKEERKRSLENTYRLEPKIRLPERSVHAIIAEALDTLESHTYSATHSPFIAKLLTTRILESVKQLNIERYKFVCLVTIGTKGSQDLRIASRCLWDDQFDTFVSVCFERQGFFAVGTVYGVYFE
ncbi:tctex1 domain-containing protein 1-like [Stylophora pistillata]|uniref:tctex1 domain-containing protein 1-like n=1 Tax=Stylophora pistillata TaxID=50429 RepID=UPI000C043902|nr:tctex1 domain-containing protein 1-like [Stylophora pistillata]